MKQPNKAIYHIWITLQYNTMHWHSYTNISNPKQTNKQINNNMGNQQQHLPTNEPPPSHHSSSNPHPTRIHPSSPTPRPTKLPPINPSTLSSPIMKRPSNSLTQTRFNVTSASKLKLKRKNSNDVLQMTENIKEEDDLSPEELDNIYFVSGANLNEFLSNLQEPLSKLYMELSKQALTFMNNRFSLTKKEAKMFLCEKMLKSNLNILKTLGQKTNHEFNEAIFKNFNELQKSIIGYLKAKYPRGQNAFVPGDLMKVFKSFDYIQNPGNDIIRQAGFYFRKENTRDLLKTIKRFLNTVIDEVDMNFPRFQKMFQDRVFKIAQKDDNKSLTYTINRRLPETIAKFTAINSNSLDIESPQLFRVILKWVSDMQEFLLSPQQQVQQKQTFKVINEEDDDKYYVDQITREENTTLLQQLKDCLLQEQVHYLSELNDLITSMYRFQQNLVKIIEQGELAQRYVPRNDADVIKFAAYNTKFMSWMLAEKLTIVMQKLIKVGRSFKNTVLMVPLDLIKFNVTDLLRALMVGTKVEILQVYANLKKLQVQDQIKIIRLDNRLSTTSNDIIINFKLKNCFLICQLQLILSESSHPSSSKQKNIESLNDFFTEMEASPYGVASQLAEYVGYKDSKVAYEKKINFVSKEVGIGMCELRHQAKVQVVKDQFQPFVCTTCSRFYGRLENAFVMKHCKECNNFLCSKCIFAKNPSLESTYLKEQIIDYLATQLATSTERNRGKPDTSPQPLTGNLIYERSFQKFTYLKDIQKQLKLKKMTITQFESYISGLGVTHFLYGVYEKGEVGLVSCKFSEGLKELSFGMDPQEGFYSSKRLGFRENDFILTYGKLDISAIDSIALQKQPYINLFTQQRKLRKGKYETYKINETTILVAFQSEQTQQKILVDGQQVVQESFYSENKKEFKFDSLKTYMEYQGIGDSGRKNLKFQDIGLEKRHLKHFAVLPWAGTIVELNLAKNKITDINELLKQLPNIERLTATENYITTLDPPTALPSLTSLVLKRNLIKTITHLQRLPSLQKLNLQQNRIQILPTLNLPKLRHLNLSLNPFLRSIAFVESSTLPELGYLNLQNSLQNVQYASNSDDEHRTLIVPFFKLKCFIVNGLKVNKLTFQSQIIERVYLSNSLVSQVITRIFYLEYLIADCCKLSNFKLLLGHNYENNFVKEINLSQNLISELPSNLFSKSLKSLNLNFNQLTDLSPLKGYELPELESLDLSYNKFKRLPKMMFKKLAEFRFEGNYFDDVEEFAQSELPLIRYVEFYADQALPAWPRFCFPKVENLSLPYLQDDGSFSEFEKSQLPSLQVLRIQNSKFQKFPTINFPTITHLYILYCTVKDLSVLAQWPLQNLQWLDFCYINAQQPATQQQQPGAPPAPAQDLSIYKLDLPLQLPHLIDINISNSRFHNIHTLLTNPYPNLQKITIQYSNLSTLPKLSLPNLKVLNLFSNKIEDIELFYQSELPQLEEIDLSFNKILRVTKMPWKSLQVLNLASNELVEISGLELPVMVRVLFSYNKLQAFPVIWAEKLNDMTFDSNPLKSLAQMSQCHLPSLKSISISSIELQPTPAQTVDFPQFEFPNLQSVSIYSTNFTHFSNINSLLKLTTLNLSYCSKGKGFPVLVLPELKVLEVSNCQFEGWGGLWESRVEALATLGVSWSNLTQLGPLKCPNLMELNVFDNQNLIQVESLFNANKFTLLDSVTITGNKNLKITTEINLPIVKKLTFNFMSLTNTRLIGPSERLKDMCLAEMSVQELGLREFKKLQNLEAVACQIQNIVKFCDTQWKCMRTLNLCQNLITHIPALTKFPALQTLYLHNNQIQTATQLLQHSTLPSLSYLCLNNNKLKSITRIRNMPKLMSLQLQTNELSDISFLSNFQNVNTYINSITLNSNRISKITKGIKTNTQSLNLTENMIEDMEWIDRSEMPRLVYLEMSCNRITKLSSVSKLTNLGSLTVADNPIEQFEEFFTKSKIPASCVAIVLSVKLEEEKIQEVVKQYQIKYPNMGISMGRYEERAEE